MQGSHPELHHMSVEPCCVFIDQSEIEVPFIEQSENEVPFIEESEIAVALIEESEVSNFNNVNANDYGGEDSGWSVQEQSFVAELSSVPVLGALSAEAGSY